MYELKKNGNVFTSKFVGTGPSSYEKRIYRAAVSQRLRDTGLKQSWHESDHSPPSSEVMKNKWNCTSIPPCMPSWHEQGQLCLLINVTSSGISFMAR